MTEFDTPQSLFKEAKKLILHQDDALKQLCVLMYYHLKQSNLHNKKAASHDIAEFLRMPELSSMSEAIEVSSIKQPPIFFDWQNRLRQNPPCQGIMSIDWGKFCLCQLHPFVQQRLQGHEYCRHWATTCQNRHQ